MTTKTSQFAYLTNKNSSFARFARHFTGAFSIFVRFAAVLNDLFCSCVGNVSTWRQILSFLFPSLSCPNQFVSNIVCKHCDSQATWNNREMITGTRSYIFHTSFLLKPAAYVTEERAEKNDSAKLFFQPFLLVRGEILMRNSPWEAEKKLKHVPIYQTNFSTKFRRTGEETAEQTALQGIFLSSLLPCSVGLKGARSSCFR